MQSELQLEFSCLREKLYNNCGKNGKQKSCTCCNKKKLNCSFPYCSIGFNLNAEYFSLRGSIKVELIAAWKRFVFSFFCQSHSRQVAWRAREKIPSLVDNTFRKLFLLTFREHSQRRLVAFRKLQPQFSCCFVCQRFLCDSRYWQRTDASSASDMTSPSGLCVQWNCEWMWAKSENTKETKIIRSICWAAAAASATCAGVCAKLRNGNFVCLFLSLSNLQKWNCRVRFWTSLRRRSRFGRENHRPMTSSRFIDNKTTQEKTQRWCHRRCARFVGLWRRLWRTERMKN